MGGEGGGGWPNLRCSYTTLGFIKDFLVVVRKTGIS